MPSYRVIRVEVDGLVPSPTPKVLSKQTVWEGIDLKELEKKFPREYFSNGNTLDQLRPIKLARTRMLTVFLARATEQEEWKPIGDPRILITRRPHEDLRYRRR
ncbi:MAG: hypothetical protein A3C88_02775 [Candidatus Yanofskybacteria bacterium RIFCSPHIGHO2_02_FULL_50_12]|uniref:Uncharacterized protein n=1 Tax=Candidatus Yanofskybacteria bacterium RIFCSPHIGHO2_02_FULL_50_12 TaxID=1802685 RepID=A0A1F8FUG6_9BACT|nr:MAG: hypothetical protein A3C88_02775 [Candidatus Yanofskybacteria bacterium RIFCSPHIGHO2_02_FULL_50_12]